MKKMLLSRTKCDAVILGCVPFNHFYTLFLGVEWLRHVLYSYTISKLSVTTWRTHLKCLRMSFYLSRCPYGSAPPGLQETHSTRCPLLQECAVCTFHNSSWNSSTDNNRNSNLSASRRWQTDPINENVRNQTGTQRHGLV